MLLKGASQITKYLNVNEARYLNVNEARLVDMVQKGLPARKKDGEWVADSNEIDRYLAKNRLRTERSGRRKRDR